MQTVNRFLYGPTIEERVNKWQIKIKSEERQIDRDIKNLENSQIKAKKQLKILSTTSSLSLSSSSSLSTSTTSNQKIYNSHHHQQSLKDCKVLAKEIVRSNKQKERLFISKARLSSIRMQLQHQLATLKVTGTLQKSTEIMKLSNSLIKLPELSHTMQEMSKEMMKAGIMSEMVEDAIDGLDEDQEELEEEAEQEVQKVLFDITDGKLGQMASVSGELPTQEGENPAAEADLEDVERMQAQLNGLLQS